MRISDWSSDVCSSDLVGGAFLGFRLRFAPDQLRQHDILDRVEIGQQMVELIDEADLLAPRLRPLALLEACYIFALDADYALEPALEQTDRLQHRRLPRPRRPEQRDDLEIGRAHA